MRFSDKAFEKAYLRIIKESAGMEDPMAADSDAEVCPDCGQAISYDEMGNPICDCSAGMEEDEDEEDEDEECDDVEECGDFEEDEDEECDDVEEDDDLEEDEDEEDDDLEEDEDEEADDADAADAEATTDDVAADAETPAEGEEAPAEGGKFISFYTTDPGLIEALQNGFATLSITPVAEDDKEAAEPVEFAADLFENLTVEDLKEDETAEGEGKDAAADDAEVTDADAEVADADAEAPTK